MNTQAMQSLRQSMRQEGLQAYILPSSDYHGSEYLHPYFRARALLSGFTGSAGTLAVLAAQAALFTDGRYFLQAAQQLAGTDITLMRLGEPGVPTLEQYLSGELRGGDTVGVDARLLDAAAWKALEQALAARNITLRDAGDLMEAAWPGRPAFPNAPAYPHPEQYAGQSIEEKLDWLRGVLREKGADAHFLCALEDIAWLYNLRGSDIPYNPVAFCYAAVEREQAFLFMEEAKPTAELRARLAEAGVLLRPYAQVAAYLQAQRGKVLFDPARVNAALAAIIRAFAQPVEQQDPVLLQKTVKNNTELANMREAHIRDGAAMVRFWKYLRETMGRSRITEISAGERLAALRREQGALEDSFSPIVAYGPHAAIVHYSATQESDAQLRPEGALLVDSGGQYREGTTDITRVFALGPVPQALKKHYTLVLQGMLRLSAAVFPQGVYGDQLDILARMPLWQNGLEYNHGTGHGVGSFLCVHEPPVLLNWRRRGAPPLAPGMVHSNEPGVYIPGSHGIRLENQMVVQQAADGYLRLETLTLAPLDLSLVEWELLQPADVAQLHAYHERVYTQLAPRLTAGERAFLHTLIQY